MGTDTNLLVSLKSWSQALSSIGVCKDCGAPLTIIDDLAGRRGLVSDVRISCTNTVCITEAKISDPRSPKAKVLNARSVLGIRNVRSGRNGLVILWSDKHAFSSCS